MMSTPNNQPVQPDDTAPILNAAWVATLAQSLRSDITLSLTPPVAQAMKNRLMQRIASSPADAKSDVHVVSIRRDDAWVSLSKKIQVKVLHDDGTTLSWLLRLLPGGRLPEHDHADGLEECMVLEGSLRINGENFGCGDYQIAHPGSVHFEVSSEQGSLVFLKSPSSRRKSFVPA
jgi:quercetin dioxygenase-like cupin family protein